MISEKHQIDFDAFFASLDVKLDLLWGGIIRSSPMLQAIENGKITKQLYAIYMMETFHYTAHNARNQALVGVRPECSAPYMKFCLEHASEEVGHEKMALHDVMSLGLKGADVVLPQPLLETEVLISYIYWVSLTGNPVQRLGYSYWAESCYRYINPLVSKLRGQLKLENSQLTFFIAHSDIDADHFEEVKNIIRRVCKSEGDLDALKRVMENTLKLTGDMLNAVYQEYERYKSDDSLRCAFLGALKD